jgi:hypothetical protein
MPEPGSNTSAKLEMAQALFALIESEQTGGRFDLYSDTGSLHAWIEGSDGVTSLYGLAASSETVGDALAQRALELFREPFDVRFRTDREPAICIYAVLLSRLEYPTSRKAVDELDLYGGPAYGCLNRLLARTLRNSSTNESVGWWWEVGIAPQGEVSEATTSMSDPTYYTSTPFETEAEYGVGEGILILKGVS